MTLPEARVEAAKKSREKSGKIVYINVVEKGEDAGECYLADKADNTTHVAYKNGSEIALEPEVLAANTNTTEPKAKASKKSKANGANVESAPDASTTDSTKNKTSKTMATTAAKKTAKKAATPAKKTATPAKKSAAPAKAEGKKRTMTVKAIIAALKKGDRVMTPEGKKHNVKKLAKISNQEIEKEVLFAEGK